MRVCEGGFFRGWVGREGRGNDVDELRDVWMVS